VRFSKASLALRALRDLVGECMGELVGGWMIGDAHFEAMWRTVVVKVLAIKDTVME
jgi:hypothetical protein